MNEYQAIYDAVRSRIRSGNISEAVKAVVREADIGHATFMMRESFRATLAQYERPSVLYRPTVVPDGSKWSALYGTNLMEGVSGFGDTPEEAMRDFDNNWWKQKTPTAVPAKAKGAAA